MHMVKVQSLKSVISAVKIKESSLDGEYCQRIKCSIILINISIFILSLLQTQTNLTILNKVIRIPLQNIAAQCRTSR